MIETIVTIFTILGISIVSTIISTILVGIGIILCKFIVDILFKLFKE